MPSGQPSTFHEKAAKTIKTRRTPQGAFPQIFRAGCPENMYVQAHGHATCHAVTRRNATSPPKRRSRRQDSPSDITITFHAFRINKGNAGGGEDIGRMSSGETSPDRSPHGKLPSSDCFAMPTHPSLHAALPRCAEWPFESHSGMPADAGTC